MKKLLFLLLLPLSLFGQSSTGDLSKKLKVRDSQARGLSKHDYKDADSLAVNVTLPQQISAKADQATTYTQTQVNNLLKGYYLPVTVPTKAAAITAATGSQPKIIKVQVDESDNNRANNKYLYDGDGQPLSYPLF